MREDVTFGGGCAGWHYVADGDAPRACVVMAHGFGATKSCGLDAFASGLRDAGHDVLVFDYRGTPQRNVDIAEQRDDYRAAVTFARERDRVDADRIVLWGASLAGGHVLEVASKDPRLAAVIALTPAVDGAATMRQGIKLTGVAGANAVTAAALRGKVIPITGPPGSVAVMTAPGSHEAYAGIAGPDWVNEVNARVVLKLGSDRPTRFAKQLKAMPVLFQVCDLDRTAPPDAAMKAAWDAEALVRHYPGDHFDVYPGGPFFERVLEHQLAFLARVVA